MSTPASTFTSVLPTLHVPHLAGTSGKEKKKLVLKAVDEVCRIWLLAPQTARCHKNRIKIACAPPSKQILGINALFIEHFQQIPDQESIISLLSMAEDDSPPTTPRLASNHVIAAKLFQDAVAQLEEDSEMICYLFELSNNKFDSTNPSFLSLQSMAWASLVSWCTQVKAAVEASRKVRKPLSNSGATPVKDKADDALEFFTVKAPNNFVAVKSVELGKQTSFLWKKAQYIYIDTVDVEGAAVQNISNLAANKVLLKNLMVVLSCVEQGLNCGMATLQTPAELPLLVYKGLISLVGSLCYSTLAHSALEFISSSSFDIDKTGADTNQLLNAAYMGGVTSSIGCEMVAFLIHCMEPKWVSPTEVGAKIKFSMQAEQPPLPADVEETALVTTPAPASKKHGIMALHSGQSVRSKATTRSQKEAAKDDE
ncbi:hypothetical protein HDU80_010595 [Chytriomyces hyalinus]|nr:hypothetical protein HDU80_010595 [Chytriomyces hyalinus]